MMLGTPNRLSAAIASVILAGLIVSAATVRSSHAEPVAAIIFNGQVNDGAFNEQGFLGTTRAEELLGTSIRQRVAGNNAETADALRAYARRGVGHLMVLGFTNTQAVRSVAAEYPDVEFTLVDGLIKDMDNVQSIQFAMEEAGYLGGYVAGLKTRTDKLGVIGGMNIPPVLQLMCGFVDGARRANPKVTFQIAFVADTVEGFRDVVEAEKLADEMISNGADVVFAAAGHAASGAARAARARGVFSVMTDANRNHLAPGSVLTTSMIRLDEAVLATWLDVWNGTWTPGVRLFTMKENGLDWAVDEHNADVVAPFRKDVELQKEGLAAGTVTVRAVPDLGGCAGVIGLVSD